MAETNATTHTAPLTSVLRPLLAVDGAIFLVSALFNLGVQIPLGFTTLGFASPVLPAAAGEIVIGTGLLAAARTGRTSHGWIAALAATVGIAFGLASQQVTGPARDIHLLLIPITAAIFVVLIAASAMRARSNGAKGDGPTTNGPPTRSGRPATDRAALAIAVLMAIASAAYAIASAVHFGLVIPLGPITLRDPFEGAAVPEALIAAVLLAGAIALIRNVDGAWLGALLASAFSTLLTMFGLSITLRMSRPGDVAYHIGVLTLVAVITALLLASKTWRRGERRTA